MNGKKIFIVIILLGILSACSYQFPEEKSFTVEDFGELNTNRVIAVGDDFYAGVMDGALYSEGQKNSVPALIVEQFNKIQPVKFIQPEVKSENGYNLYMSTEDQIFGKWIYRFANANSEKPELILTQGEHVNDFEGDISSIDNLAIPNLQIQKLKDPLLAINPYYGRIAKIPGSGNLFSDITERNPTLALVWVGMGDFLGHAINGGSNESSENKTGWQLSGELTSIDTFEVFFKDMVENLLQNSECKIAIGNLISIHSFPFFYIRPYNQLFLTGSQLGPAREIYREFNLGVAEYNRTVSDENKRPFIDFYDNGWNLHPQPMVVTDNSLPDATYPDGRPLEKFRQLTNLEMVLFSVTDEMIAGGYGSVIPLTEEYYLSENEIFELEQRVSGFNSVIKSLAENNYDRIIVANVAGKVKEIANSGKTDAWGDPLDNKIFYSEGVPVEGSLGINSIFSLDGLHFNSRGNAFIANVFIEEINNSFNARIPLISINNFKGNTYSVEF